MARHTEKCRFLQRDAMLNVVNDVVVCRSVCMSVCLCVCNATQYPHDSSFLSPKIMVKFERDHPLWGRQMPVGWVKIGHVRLKTCYNSKTVQDRRIVSINSNRKSYLLYQMATLRFKLHQFDFSRCLLQTCLSQAAHSRQPCVNSHQLSQWESLGNSHFSPPTKSTYLNRSL